MPRKSLAITFCAISAIDPASNRVARVVPAGPGAYAARVAFGSLWVTSYAGSDVRRFALR